MVAPSALVRRALFRRVVGILLACITLVPASGLPAVAGNEALPAETAPLRSAAEIGYPPFSLVDENGTATGFSVELLRAALHAMGRGVAFRTGPWAEVKGWLETGEVEALPLVGRTPEREKLFDFTFPYMSLHGAIVVREGTTGIRRLEDLRGRRVAVMKGDNAEEFLRRKERGMDIRTTATFDEALVQLSEGTHDAVFIQRLVALRLIQENGIRKLRVVDRPVEAFSQDFCFSVREGDRDTLALLNEGLSVVMADGTYRRLHAKWFAALELPTRRRIVIGGDYNYPPFEFLDENGRPAGFNTEIARAVAREVGLDVEIRLGPWSQIRQALADGEIDAVQGMLYSPERDRVFDFTQPYTVNHYVGVVRKEDAPAPASAEDLRAKRIVVQKDDIMHDFVRENGLGRRVSTVDAQEDALRELAEGKHDCALVARLTALYWMEKFGWEDLVIGRHALVSPEYGFAVPQNRSALLAAFSEGLAILEQTGEYRRIREKWLGVYEDAPPGFAEVLRTIVVVVVPLVLMVLVFFLWSWSLRKEVKKRTRDLQERETILNATGKMGKIGGWEHDLRTGRAVWTEALYDIIDIPYDREPPGVGEHLDYYPPADREVLERAYGEAVETGKPFDLELQVHTTGGKRLWCRAQGTPVFEDGRCVKLRGTFQDVTERKEAEEALRRSEEKYRHIYENAVEGFYLSLPEGRFLEVNPAFAHMLGYASPEEMVAAITDIATQYYTDPEDRIRFQRKLEKYGAVSGSEFRALRKDGTPVWVSDSSRAYFDKEGKVLRYEGIVNDIHERKEAEAERERLQAQLMQARKMEAIGTLAGGIAHDFNNILSSIIGFTELSMEDAEPGSDLAENLQEVYTAGKRARDLVAQILTFSRQSDLGARPLLVRKVAEEAIRLLRSTLPATIEIRQDVRCEAWVTANPAQIHQLFLNLCTNAAHAMAEDGGVLAIRLSERTVEDGRWRDHMDVAAGRYVEISVSDTGEGIAPEHLPSIFDPYFTTKGPKEGTGLGLAVVHGIVQRCGGAVSVDSRVDEGTRFVLLLPATEGSPGETAADPGEPPTGNERVLLVDDEEPIARMGRHMLESLGYAVVALSSSRQALERFQADPDGFDIVVTDMTMPEMNGDRLAQEILRIRPDVPIILCTGYSSRISRRRAAEIGIAAFAMKPMDKRELAETVRRALDGIKWPATGK